MRSLQVTESPVDWFHLLEADGKGFGTSSPLDHQCQGLEQMPGRFKSVTIELRKPSQSII